MSLAGSRVLLVMISWLWGSWAWAEPAAHAMIAQAMLEPADQATLSSQIAARILKVTVDEGEAFEAGKTLIQFECAIPHARLAKAQAELRAEQKRLDVQMRMKNMVGTSDLELAMARANVERAQAEVGMAQAENETCDIKAPYDGRVARRYVHAHDGVSRGDKLLGIVSQRTLRVRLYTPATWITWIKTGTRFVVTAPEIGPKSFPARIVSLGAQVDPSSQTLGVIGELNAPSPELLPGLNVIATFDGPGPP